MGTVRRFLRQDRDYFSTNTADIHQQNYNLLRFACICYCAILLIYTGVTLIYGQSKTLTVMYFAFDGVHIILCSVVFGLSSQIKSNTKLFAALRVVFEISLLSFFLIEAVFPFPNEQSIYLPFPLILLVTAFIYKPRHVLLLIIPYVAIFVYLVCAYKSPNVRLNDIYIAAATLISATIGYIITANLRHETSSAMVRLKYLSMTDPMTSLYNKQTFETLCKAYIGSDSDKGHALLFIDVDKFKQINDAYGHPFGDAVLKSIAAVLKDAFYDKDYICRFGGDEFMVFMVDITNETYVYDKIKILNNKINSLAEPLGLKSLSCSIGIAYSAIANETYSALLSRADSDLYVAKERMRRQAKN